MTGSVDPIQKPFTVAIVGGGIGGIALAIGLLHRGIAVQVYEAAPAFAEIGAGIGFGPNSVRSMYLISPAIKAAFDGLVTKNEGKDEEETWINFRCGMGEPELIAKVRTTDSDKTGISSVHRAYFLNRLVKFVPEDVANFGKRLLNLHPGPASTVRLEFEDGTMAEADAVVGCDGVRSRVRRILRAQESDVEDMKFSRKVAYRGLIPMDKARAALGDNLAGNAQMYIGPGGSILTYPIDHGKTLNVAAFRTKEDGRWEHSRWMLPKTREDVKESYRGWGVPVQKITEMMDDPVMWALFDHSPAPSYYAGHVAILGDAAHASTPHQGAGAGQALEDAFILSSLLADPQIESASDIPKAFKAYDAIRRPRSQKVVITSRAAGEMYGYDGPDGADLRKIGENLAQRQRWIWEEDMDKQLEKAQGLLDEYCCPSMERERAQL